MSGKIIILDEVVQQRKDRKISKELNATIAHGNALDAREMRIGELKWLLEFEGGCSYYFCRGGNR